MFGYKSAGIVEELVNALRGVRARGAKARLRAQVVAPEVSRMAQRNETYIAATQFTVVSMPFFRWRQ